MAKLLERILDALCKATGRDIFIIFPEEKFRHSDYEKIKYLKKEILLTLDLIEKGVK